MATNTIIGFAVLLLGLACGLYVVIALLFPRRTANMRSLMSQESAMARSQGGKFDPGAADLEQIKKEVRKKSRKDIITLEEKFFQAGIFTKEGKRSFYILRAIGCVVLAPAMAVLGAKVSPAIMIAGMCLGGAFGFRIPYMWLDSKLKSRQEDILFYLPLVIEQVVIGVSSSLDIGPCIQRVVQMADERDSHNSVTELLQHAEYYLRSGISLQDALVEIGRKSGHTELKHAFMSLASVAKHGGEVTRQLQELADAVSNQREAKIETKIKKLELQATVPVAVVFFGFLIIILAGFGLQVQDAFK